MAMARLTLATIAADSGDRLGITIGGSLIIRQRPSSMRGREPPIIDCRPARRSPARSVGLTRGDPQGIEQAARVVSSRIASAARRTNFSCRSVSLRRSCRVSSDLAEVSIAAAKLMTSSSSSRPRVSDPLRSSGSPKA
jgi:hypothetical protein